MDVQMLENFLDVDSPAELALEVSGIYRHEDSVFEVFSILLTEELGES